MGAQSPGVVDLTLDDSVRPENGLMPALPFPTQEPRIGSQNRSVQLSIPDLRSSHEDRMCYLALRHRGPRTDVRERTNGGTSERGPGIDHDRPDQLTVRDAC